MLLDVASDALEFYEIDRHRDQLTFYGGQLRRPQKWGKDPFGAALVLAEAMGPARFDGWDSDGEPVGAPYPTPYVPILGVSEDQTDNTYLPLLTVIRESADGPRRRASGSASSC